MKFKYLLITLLFGVCANAHAEWFLRGTQTTPAWTATQMVSAGAGTNTMQLTNVVFTTAGSVKFDRFGDWFENYGVGGRNGSNIAVAAGTWDIKFFTDTKNWSITPSTTAEVKYHIRGTFNAWAEGTLMTRVDSSAIYTSCINFVGGDVNGGPRFKIDPNGGWGNDSVPASDFQVFPGWVKVTFNSSSKAITVEQNLASNCGVTASSSSVASSSVASSSKSSSSAVSSSATNSSVANSSSSSSVSSFAHTFNSLNLRTSLNSWGSQPMTLIANHVWQGQTSTQRSTANQFKFDVFGDWSLNFGENQPKQGIADQNGANILVDGCANFDCTSVNVRFKDDSHEYALCYNSQFHADTGITSLCSL